MNSELHATIDMMRAIKKASRISVNRHFEGFFADRILQAVSAPTLLDMIEALAKGLDVSIEYIGGRTTAAFMTAAHGTKADSVLAWIREHPRIAAMVAGLRDDDDYGEAIGAIELPDIAPAGGGMVDIPPREYDIPIRVRLLSPLAHGADGKAGNATVFRRRQVLTGDGGQINLPYYGGNALRGQLRDLLADHFLSGLGVTPRRDKPPVAIWFFHCLYAGGVLEERSKAMAAVDTELGKSGSLRTDGLRRIRDMLPVLSLLGTAIGNRILPGRICVGDLRPICREWGSGDVPVARLMQWEYLTRHDNYEGKGVDADHAGMIATTECIREGAELVGGIDLDTHISEIERSALGMGLRLLSERGKLGAENRRGLGMAEINSDNAPDPQPYITWLQENRTQVIEYLEKIGAINTDASSVADILCGPF